MANIDERKWATVSTRLIKMSFSKTANAFTISCRDKWMPNHLVFRAADRRLPCTLSPKRQPHPMEHIGHVFDRQPIACVEYHLYTIETPRTTANRINWLIDRQIVCCAYTLIWDCETRIRMVEQHSENIYLSTWDLQNGRREFSSIIRCIPMSEIKTADSMATHSTHNAINVVARKLVIFEKWVEKKHQ